MSEVIAVIEVEVEIEVLVARCACGKPKSHAPYGERMTPYQRLKAGLLRRPLVNRPCPTPRMERQIKTEIREMTLEEISRVTGGILGDSSN